MLAARAMRHNYETARKLFGLAIVYRRKTLSVPLDVAVGRTIFEQGNEEGVVVRGRVRDYLIKASELVLNGDIVWPEPGDTIEHWVGGTKMIQEVRPVADGRHWRDHDPAGETIRVHTVHLKSET